MRIAILFVYKKYKSIMIKLYIIHDANRRNFTVVQGLPTNLDRMKILRALKKTFQCGGSITSNSEFGEGELLLINGDHRQDIFDFFVKYQICSKNDFQMHGF